MKDILCRAFCDAVSVERVPAGFAITTPYQMADGDPIILFALLQSDGNFVLEDSGVQIPLLEASGVNVNSGLRGEAFAHLVAEYSLDFDREDMVVRSPAVHKDSAGEAALNMLGFLLRLQDFELLTPDRVRRTWQDDAMASLHAKFDEIATVTEHEAVYAETKHIPADAVIRFNDGASPVAVFLATSDSKGLQALVLKMEVEKYQKKEAHVVLLVERAKNNPLREPTYALAQARLDDVLTYRGAEADAMGVIADYARTRH